MTSLDKKAFIDSLKNHAVSYQDNQRQYEQLQSNQPDVFQAFNPDVVTLEAHQHRWEWEYFDSKFSFDIPQYFSHELIRHLIEVKQHLQAQNLEATPVYQEELSSPTPHETPVSTKESQTVAPTTPSIAKPDLTGFELPERLAGFLQSGDIGKIRNDLISILNNRRISIKDVICCAWVVYESTPNVFDETEDSAFLQEMDSNTNNWNLDYFLNQQTYLSQNFTLERLFHLINVRETLLKRGDKDFQQIQVAKPRPAPSPSTTPKSQTSTNTADSHQTASTSTHSQNTHSTSYQEEEDKGLVCRFCEAAKKIGGDILGWVLGLFGKR